MPIFIPTVEHCPVAKQSQGLIEIEPEIIGWLAGAVHKEPDEWLAILLGEVYRDGLHVIVDNIYVPPKQHRTSGTCRVTEKENSLDGVPEHIIPHIVGVVHSHHKMGAFFSGGDKAKEGVNSTFPMSIVISSAYTEMEEEAILLGFNYDAELKYDAPCGSLLIAKAKVIPRGVEDWPFRWPPVIPTMGGAVSSLHDCDNHKLEEVSQADRFKYTVRRSSKCGLVTLTTGPRNAVFGANGQPILEKLPPATREFTGGGVIHVQGMSKKERKRARKWYSGWSAGKKDDDRDDEWKNYGEW